MPRSQELFSLSAASAALGRLGLSKMLRRKLVLRPRFRKLAPGLFGALTAGGLISSLAIFAAVTTAPTPVAWAESSVAESQGLEIAEEAYRRERGFGDYRVKMVMILRDRRGDETRRELEAWTLEAASGDDKSLVYFHSPRDIRGTSLLTYSHRNGDDEQWLYLPALRRTKRISVTGRSAPFMGSQFSYEDLVATHVSNYSYRLVRIEKLRKAPCWVIERIPKYSGSGYRRQHVWIDQAEYRVLQVQYWDRRDRPLKKLTLGGYRRYGEKFWKPSQARMDNQRTKDSTLLQWRDYQFRTGLTDGDFNRDALQRAR